MPHFTVCPYHQSSLGLNWKRKTSCVFPGHTGKSKGDRPISYRTSYALISQRGTFLPIGSAICKVCKTKTFNILESFPNMMDIIPGDEDSGEIKINDQFSVVEQNQPTNKCMQSEDMTAKEENDMISEDEASIWISQSDSENYTVSLPSSQISSWSTENDIQKNTLEEINSALNIIGGVKISPITYQIRKDVNELKPRTVRSLKRKASATVHEALDCLAPFQAKKVWQLIDMDLVNILPLKHKRFMRLM
ncbi:unnamed protein product [Mytilus coruscus]|uniref:Uncharacterized protein n=1 Tax=Mytilus coruscus TaxID=42192 RepID=A0A6J8CW11_MYTCO|nr:unnamed protein product [Mytilus coruscus]